MKPGYLTTEFWLSLLANAIAAAVATGLIGTGGEAIKIAAFATMLLATLGYTASRAAIKAPTANPIAGQLMTLDAASSAVRLPESGIGAPVVMLGLAIAGFLFVASCSLFTSSGGKALGGDVVDCTTSAAKSTIHQFGPVVASNLAHAVDGAGHVDWASIKADTKSFGVDVGGCVLASVVAMALHPAPADPNAPKSSQLEIDPASLRAGFDDIRRSTLGGKTYKLEGGAL